VQADASQCRSDCLHAQERRPHPHAEVVAPRLRSLGYRPKCWSGRGMEAAPAEAVAPQTTLSGGGELSCRCCAYAVLLLVGVRLGPVGRQRRLAAASCHLPQMRSHPRQRRRLPLRRLSVDRPFDQWLWWTLSARTARREGRSRAPSSRRPHAFASYACARVGRRGRLLQRSRADRRWWPLRWTRRLERHVLAGGAGGAEAAQATFASALRGSARGAQNGHRAWVVHGMKDTACRHLARRVLGAGGSLRLRSHRPELRQRLHRHSQQSPQAERR
jgi:hypothetical protein